MVSTRTITAVAAICAGLFAMPCGAQTRLSLREAVDRALESRASLKAETERIASAEGLKQQAAAWPNPEFQFQNENLRPGQDYANDVDTLAYFIQPLDILGKRGKRIEAAEQGIARTQAELEQARWQVVRQVRLAYWDARGAQESRDRL